MLIAAALVALLPSCVRDDTVDCDMSSATVALSLTTGSSFTRGDDHYDDDAYASTPEELIDRVALFFYSSADDQSAEPFYVASLSGVNGTAIAEVKVKIPIDLKSRFVDGKAYVYALVNLPGEIEVNDTDKTVDGRKATLQNLSRQWVENPSFDRKESPSSFVMRGGGEVTLTTGAGGTSVTGVVRLERLASKIRLWAELPERIYLDENGRTIDESEAGWQERVAETWEPVLDGQDGDDELLLYLYNMTTRGRMDAFLGSEQEHPDLKYVNIDRSDACKDVVRRLVTGDELKLPAADRDTKYTYSHSMAYYSYPNRWENTSQGDEHRTYVVVGLPWKRQDTGDGTGELYQMCYYQVPVNVLHQGDDDAAANCLEPNKYYRIKLRIGMLGSKDLGSPLPVNAGCEVVDWVTADVDVNIKSRRYLVVNQKEWVMNNVSTIEIPFSSSHEVDKVYCYVTYFRYNDIWGTAADTQGEAEINEFELWLDAADDQLKSSGGKNAESGLVTASFERQSNPKMTRKELTHDGYTGLRHDRTYEIDHVIDKYTYEDEDLYYKKEYFFDKVKNSFLYYLGHEHPRTFQQKYVENNAEKNPKVGEMTAAEQRAWELYNSKYDNINAVYTCDIDNNKGVIRFTHPLVQWKDVRTTKPIGERQKVNTQTDVDRGFGYRTETITTTYVDNYSSEMQYYVPELNPRTDNLWDEFSRCEIVIKIHHKDWDKNDLYEETVYITQYPAMYVEVSHDYGTVYSNRYVQDSRYPPTGHYEINGNEYVLVNGNTTENIETDRYDTATEWFEVTGFVSYFGMVNNNPNMYVIHTTQFSEENESLYELGDSRTLFYNDDLSDESFKNLKSNQDKPSNNKWRSKLITSSTSYQYDDQTIADGKRLYENSDNDKKLKYYYPTDESEGAGSKENFVAPSFRIASSLGKVSLTFVKQGSDLWNNINGTSRAEARRRCASYQEAGRPAGRWRVPTMAEIKYLVQLSADEKIPHLFGLQNEPDMYIPYWSSTGIVGVKVNGAVVQKMEESKLETAPAVRCVYDDWYWTQIDGGEFKTPKEVLETEFYWGDIPKDNTQTQSLVQKSINKKPIIAIDKKEE